MSGVQATTYFSAQFKAGGFDGWSNAYLELLRFKRVAAALCQKRGGVPAALLADEMADERSYYIAKLVSWVLRNSEAGVFDG